MKMQTVAVLGAGAVGSYVIWGLAGKPGIRLGVLAEGERAARLKANGIGINGRTYRPEVWAPEEAHGVDFLVVCLKYGALPGAMDSIRKAVGEHTVVMSLMNGVDSEERIAAEVGDAHVIRSLIKVASHKEADGFHFDPDATLGIIFGEQEAPFQSERVQAIVELFEGSGIHYRVTEHIREEMWAKFRLNVCNNLPQAILGAGVGCYRDSVHMQAISDGLRRELEAIAAAKGIDLRIADAAAGRCRAAYGPLLHIAGSGRRTPHRDRHVLRCPDADGGRAGHPDALQRIHLPHDQGTGRKERRPVRLYRQRGGHLGKITKTEAPISAPQGWGLRAV